MFIGFKKNKTNLKCKRNNGGGLDMVSGVNQNDPNLLQLLLSSLKNGSSTSGIGSNAGASNGDLSGIGSIAKSAKNSFLNCLQDNFSKIDANSDGQLSQDEIGTYFKNNHPMGPPPGMFIENMSNDQTSQTQANSIDDKDSKIGEHLKKRLQKAFDKLDTNQDGTISKDEVNAFISSLGTQSTNSKVATNAADAFSSVFKNLSASGSVSNLIEQFTKNLSNTYGSQSSVSNLLSSAHSFSI